jgi:DNA-binding transcriptional MerR regulator
MLDVNKKTDIPSKKYFSIGEVSVLCGVRPHVLRYWEDEFSALEPLRKKSNRRYYQKNDILLIRTIKNLLYKQGLTVSGANKFINNKKSKDSTRGGDTKNFNARIIKELEDTLFILKDHH